MPLIGILMGGVDFAGLGIQVGSATLLYGNFIQAIISFLIIALVLFLIIRAANRLMRAKAEAPVPPAPTAEEKLLTEIRDLLQAQNSRV